MTKGYPTILTIFGITGDLASRKLMPAISGLLSGGSLPDDFIILGVSRKSDVDIEKLLVNVVDKDSIKKHLVIFQMDLDDKREYDRLANKLEEIQDGFQNKAQRLFYLSVPPQASGSIIELLGSCGLANIDKTKLLVEKPFGVDINGAQDLVAKIDKYFTSEQVYRIDHYLAKEMAHNIIVYKKKESVKNTWNKDFIEHIEIIANEVIGIEGRSAFYEQTGALRDVVQSHLLEIAALVLMDTNDNEDVTIRKLAVLKSLNISTDKPLYDYVKRGQYSSYRDEVKNPNTNVETYVSMTLQSDDPNWIGVPIILNTGKMWDKRVTQVRIFYKKDKGIDPTEIIFDFNNKPVNYKHEGYEKVILDAINGDHSTFLSSEEALELWRIVTPVQLAWAESNKDLIIYKEGSSSILG